MGFSVEIKARHRINPQPIHKYFEELVFFDATALADLVRRRRAKPIELVEASIERIEALNPTLNAVVTPMYDQAREAAKGKLPDGPFTGVPFLVKNILAACKGAPMTLGTTSDIPVSDDCIKAVEETAALCRDLGHEVEEAALEFGIVSRPSLYSQSAGADFDVTMNGTLLSLTLASNTCY